MRQATRRKPARQYRQPGDGERREIAYLRMRRFIPSPIARELDRHIEDGHGAIDTVMGQMSLVRHALNNRWLEEQGVPDMRPRQRASASISSEGNRRSLTKEGNDMDQASLRA